MFNRLLNSKLDIINKQDSKKILSDIMEDNSNRFIEQILKRKYDKKEIFVGSGAKHVLYNLFQVLLDAGDEVIIPAPYWVSYPEQVRIAGGKPIILTTEQSNGFKVTPSEIQGVITDKTKILVLN